MATSPQFQKLVQTLFARRPPSGPFVVEALRQGFEATALAIGDVVVEQLTAPGADPSRVVLYLHGGGFVIGSPITHRKLAGDIGRAAGVRVLLPDYPLAPEQPFPAAIEWITALYLGLLGTGVAPEHVAIGGDSAGGGLSAAVLVALRDRGAPLPAAAVLLSPWLDLVRADVDGDAQRALRDPIIAPADLATFQSWYLGAAEPRDPLASPVLADLAGLPPTLVQVGEAEVIVHDSRRYAERCRAAGVAVDLEVWSEMIHVWHVFAGRVPEATAAVERVGAFLRQHLRGAS